MSRQCSKTVGFQNDLGSVPFRICCYFTDMKRKNYFVIQRQRKFPNIWFYSTILVKNPSHKIKKFKESRIQYERNASGRRTKEMKQRRQNTLKAWRNCCIRPKPMNQCECMSLWVSNEHMFTFRAESWLFSNNWDSVNGFSCIIFVAVANECLLSHLLQPYKNNYYSWLNWKDRKFVYSFFPLS